MIIRPGIRRAGLLSSVTDFFSGFNRLSDDSFTGGPTSVLDYAGALITPPVNRMGIEGGSFVNSVWVPATTPAHYVKTRKGTLPKFDSAFKGFLNEPARTNYFLNSAAPVTQNITTSAQQYTVSVRGAGSITLSGTATGVATEASPLTVTATAGTLICTVAGSLQHAQVEAGTFKTSPITTTGATATRAATVYSRPTAGVLRANDWGVWGRVVPTGVWDGVAGMLVASKLDASNDTATYFQSASSLIMRKKVAGVNSDVIQNYAYSSVPFEYQCYQSSVYGQGLRIKQDGGAWAAWSVVNTEASKAPAVLGNDYQIGIRGNINIFPGNFPFTAIIQHSDPKAELEKLAARYTTI